MPTKSPRERHRAAFQKFLKADQVLSDPAECAHFATDRTTKYAPHASLVLFPRTTDEVSRILKYCHKHDVKIVPSGGRTGLAGGAVATQGEVVLSLTKMNRIIEVELLTPYIHAEAGCVTQTLMDELHKQGIALPVDFAAKGSATIGGNVSTNVGGLRVIRYGTLRGYIMGLKAVLADGTIVDSLYTLYKNNAGFDVKQLFIASEGTLGIVTEVILRAVPLATARQTYLASAENIDALLSLLNEMRRQNIRPVCFEFFNALCLQNVRAHLGLASPFANEQPYYVLLEFEDQGTEAHRTEKFLLDAINKKFLADIVRAESSEQCKYFWQFREQITESLSPKKPYKNDVSVPLKSLKVFIADLLEFLKQNCRFEVCLFGHLGDGNVHINLLKPEGMDNDDFVRVAKTLDPKIYKLVFSYAGSISAEHGIGLGKKDGVVGQFRAGEFDILKKLKGIFDPKNILNPGKIF